MIDVDDLLSRISPEQRLLLVAALAPVEPAREAWSQWRRAVVFDDIDGTATRLLPILARRPEVVDRDDPVVGRVQGLYRRSWAANERALSAADEAGTALAAAGVDVLHVEAVPLAAMLGDHGTRPLWDVDVCVPRRSIRTAVDVLRRLGWSETPRRPRARWQHWPRHLARGDARLRLIDSHPWPGADPGAWSRATPGTAPGVRRLAPHDLLVHAAVRSTQRWQPSGGYWVADLARLADALGHPEIDGVLDDSEVLDCARSHGAVDVVTAAVLASGRILG